MRINPGAGLLGISVCIFTLFFAPGIQAEENPSNPLSKGMNTDLRAPLIPTRKSSSVGAQMDPAQKRARSSGRSPKAILAPTFSDTLNIATAGKAKIFGISGKDRSAVAMAGQAGTAYWYSTNNSDFQSSAYYLKKYPDWVSNWTC